MDLIERIHVGIRMNTAVLSARIRREEPNSGGRSYPRNREVKAAAVTRFTVHPNFPAVHFYEALCNRQTQPGAPLFDLDRFPSIKPFENLGLFIQGNAAPGICDAKLHKAILIGFRLDANLAALRGKFYGVLNKVGKNLMQLIPIGMNRHRLAMG